MSSAASTRPGWSRWNGSSRSFSASPDNPPLRDHVRALAAGPLLDVGEAARARDEIGEAGLRVLVELALRRLVALDIDAQRRADRARAGQAIDDARAALEHHAHALMGRI